MTLDAVLQRHRNRYRAKVLMLLYNRPNLPYHKVAEQVGVSQKMVNSVATEAGIKRQRGPKPVGV
jgi:hypothetical protein